MPLFFPGSSESFITQPPEHAPAPAVSDKLAELSTDEPLPTSYKTDRVRMMAQSPRRIYLYWELARNPFETLGRAFGNGSAGYRLVVRLTDVDTGTQTLHEASNTRSQWFDVQPGHSYRAEIGLYAPGRAFIRLLSSNVKRTPPASVSHLTETSDEWHVSPEQFARVLDDAGYTSDAMEVALEAADEATEDGATRAVALKLGAGSVPHMNAEELRELRGMLTALAFGMPWMSLRAMLSARLAAWFDTLDVSRDDFDPSRLTEALQSTLGIEMSRNPLEAPPEAARRRAARVIVGGSEVNLPSRPFHLWMPSMTERQVRRMKDEG